MNLPRIGPFEKYPDKYEKWFNKNRYAYESELVAVKDQLPEEGFGIEIGMGSGKFGVPLGILIGVEPSEKMREISKRKGIVLIDAIGEELPLRHTFFDFVLMVTTICFLDDINASFKEVFRILKPHGAFIIGFIERNSIIGRKYQKHKKESVFYRIAEFYSVDEVVAELKGVGFSTFNFKQTIFKTTSAINEVEATEKGYGDGSFVVIKAIK